MDLKNIISKDDENPPLQNLITALCVFWKYFKTSIEEQKNLDEKYNNLELKTNNAYFIQVRGDGNCLFYSIAVIFCLIKGGKNIYLLETIFVGYTDPSIMILKNNIPDSINSLIIGMKHIFNEVTENFIELSNQIATFYCKKNPDVFANITEVEDILEFKKNFETSANFSLSQLGKILCIIKSCIIIVIQFDAIFANLILITPSLEIEETTLLKKRYLDMINANVCEVIILFTFNNRHYYSFIPYYNNKIETISELNKKFFKENYEKFEVPFN